MNLLIVDDEEGLRRSVRRLLERQGISVVGEAPNGEEAVRLVAELAPDAVLMDLRMPVQNGIDAIRAIRASGSPVPIILHTAYDDPTLTGEAIAAGASRCIIKGSPPSMIKDVLLELVEEPQVGAA